MRGLDPYQVLIVASMIERETVVPAERAAADADVFCRNAREYRYGC